MKNNHLMRIEFAKKFEKGEFVTDKSGVKTVEIVGSSFVANEPFIFGTPNEDYIRRELAWYESQSRNVNDIEAPVPVIWQKCATPDGRINSNYGWCIYSAQNGSQYHYALAELLKNPDSRRAEMIYTRPNIHTEYNTDGMSDFICTEAVQYFIRDNKLEVVVKMRSNDAVYGFNNDYAWQKHVQAKLLKDLNKEGHKYKLGKIHWAAGSIHVYERHFNFIEDFINEHKHKD